MNIEFFHANASLPFLVLLGVVSVLSPFIMNIFDSSAVFLFMWSCISSVSVYHEYF